MGSVGVDLSPHNDNHNVNWFGVVGGLDRIAGHCHASPSHGNVAFMNEAYLSPEEEIIFQRSHRRRSLPGTSSRHRLQYDTNFLQIMPPKDRRLSYLSQKRRLSSPAKLPSPKKKCIRQSGSPVSKTVSPVLFHTKLHAFNTSQLVGVVDALVQCHPEVDQVVRKLITVPDLQTLCDKLACLKHNIYRSLPTVRFGSSRDASCYRRAKVHLSTFKKACLEEGKLLLLSQDWNLLILYVLSAWKYVHGLPDWDDASHNAIKKQCFQTLAAQCMVAIKRKPFDSSSLEDLRKRLQKAVQCSKEIEPCLRYVEKLSASKS
ncbi:hypothetical protein LSH36_170g01007 [Paralvinella palmiformis]|uniref:Uncharacterized protein n=1 Tax=Paralvinella palmiformis TaxID=53620 RepID=A0AAD9N7M8_9ANNE|nr:hypothetical protein LSH36_170g01007 [Paralvinella palmiformis]